MFIGPGTLIDERYRVLTRIGEGGMGTVWAARREPDGTEVALKVLKAGGVDQMRRLLREARIAQRLEHPNVVRVHEILHSGDTPTVVMERLFGASLRERLGREPRPTLGECARILVEVSKAVSAAHALGIVHRDLKPENVFLHVSGPRATVKVLDFGIAKVAAAGDLHTAGMTHTGAMLGTPCYMAPEQVFGEGDVDARADVWALGVLLFELVSGSRPFEGENYGQVFKAITMGEAPRLRALAPDAPEALDALGARMLSRERAERPELTEVAACFERFANATVTPPPSATVTPPPTATATGDDRLLDALAPTLHATPAQENANTPDAMELGRATSTPAFRAAGSRRRRVLLAVGGALALSLVAIAKRPWSTPESAPPAPLTVTSTPALSASALAVAQATPPPTSTEPPLEARPAPGPTPSATESARAALPTEPRGPGARATPAASAMAPRVLPGGVHGVSPY